MLFARTCILSGPDKNRRVLLGKPLDELYPVQKAGYLDCFGDKSMASSGMGVGALERMWH